MLEKDGMASSNRDEMTTTKLRVETLGSQLRQYQKEVGIGADSTTTTPKHVVNYTTTNIQFLKELLSNVEIVLRLLYLQKALELYLNCLELFPLICMRLASVCMGIRYKCRDWHEEKMFIVSYTFDNQTSCTCSGLVKP